MTLLFTLPSTGQNKWVAPSADGDSVHVECSGGQAIHQLATARLYFVPVTGGGWRLIAEHGVSGREGQPDSFVVDNGPGGHYYVTATNPKGESCASPDIYVPGSVTTGVDPTVRPPSPVRVQTFDVQGRLCRSLVRSGIYFERIRYKDGRVRTHKVVLLK